MSLIAQLLTRPDRCDSAACFVGFCCVSRGRFSDLFCHGAIWPGSGCFVGGLELSPAWLLAEHSLDRCLGDTVFFGDLAEALALLPGGLEGGIFSSPDCQDRTWGIDYDSEGSRRPHFHAQM